MNSEKVRGINEWVSRSFPNNERIEIETISFSLHQPSIVCALLKWLLKVVIGLVAKQIDTLHKKKFSIKDFFSKYDQIHIFLRIWSHLLKKSLMENFIFCAVTFISMPFIVIFLLLWKEYWEKFMAIGISSTCLFEYIWNKWTLCKIFFVWNRGKL